MPHVLNYSLKYFVTLHRYNRDCWFGVHCKVKSGLSRQDRAGVVWTVEWCCQWLWLWWWWPQSYPDPLHSQSQAPGVGVLISCWCAWGAVSVLGARPGRMWRSLQSRHFLAPVQCGQLDSYQPETSSHSLTYLKQQPTPQHGLIDTNRVMKRRKHTVL